MNWDNFYKSGFFNLGCHRFNIRECDFVKRDIAMYDVHSRHPFTVNDEHCLLENYRRPISLFEQLTLSHLSFLLKTPGEEFLPSEFRNLICQQWSLVDLEIKNICSENNTNPGGSLLIIQPPGTYIPKHAHPPALVTLTFSFGYDNSGNTGRDGHIKIWDNTEQIYKYTSNSSCYFSISNSRPHESYVEDWRFFYFYDFYESSLPIKNIQNFSSLFEL